jgi:hypothetical protein
MLLTGTRGRRSNGFITTHTTTANAAMATTTAVAAPRVATPRICLSHTEGGPSRGSALHEPGGKALFGKGIALTAFVSDKGVWDGSYSKPPSAGFVKLTGHPPHGLPLFLPSSSTLCVWRPSTGNVAVGNVAIWNVVIWPSARNVAVGH